METIAFLILVGVIIEMVMKPRFDYTRDKKLLLWYGRGEKRKYIVIN